MCLFFYFFFNFGPLFDGTRPDTKLIYTRRYLGKTIYRKFIDGFCLFFLLLWNGNSSLSESITETSADNFEVGHAASTSHLPADGLLRPVVAAYASSGESTWGTCFLLNVEGWFPVSTAQGVRLVATFTKWAGSLSHSDLFGSGTGKLCNVFIVF